MLKKMLLCLTLVTSIVSSTAIAQAATNDSPAMFRGNPQHTGIYNTKGVKQLNGIKWKFKTDGKVFSSPALHKGIIYVGSNDKNLYAIDIKTGALKWKFKTGGAVSSSPAVIGNMVYFGSFDGKFYAVDTKSGKQKWSFKTEGENHFGAINLYGTDTQGKNISDPFDFFLSSPVYDKGVVYFGSGDGNVYALNAATGKFKWKFKTNGVVHSSPAVYREIVYIGSWDGNLYALNAKTGKELWRRKTGEDPQFNCMVGIQGAPAVKDNTVYFGCRDGNLYALDSESGKDKWNYSANGSWVLTSPAVDDKGKVYFGTSDTRLFLGVNANSGEEKFTFDVKNYAYSSPAIADGLAYFGSCNGRLYAMDTETGKLIWTFQTEASKINAAGILDAEGGFAIPLDGSSGESMHTWVNNLFSAGSILSSPVVDNGIIYFGSTDGYVYALY